MKVNGIWGSVCLKGFDEGEANMVCRKLGFKGGKPYLAKAAKSKYPILMSQLECNGNEKSIDQCGYLKVGQSGSCDYNSDKAGVLCHKTEGNVHMYYNV